MASDVVEKENVREYANKAIDKQKNNRYEEKTKKKSINQEEMILKK